MEDTSALPHLCVCVFRENVKEGQSVVYVEEIMRNLFPKEAVVNSLESSFEMSFC